MGRIDRFELSASGLTLPSETLPLKGLWFEGEVILKLLDGLGSASASPFEYPPLACPKARGDANSREANK